MSTGSARLISDLVGARTPEIDARDLAISRYA
jgi:D-amino-acid dehydrogenase